jgi:hypothetical protein
MKFAGKDRAEDAFDDPPAAGLGGERAVEDVGHPGAVSLYTIDREKKPRQIV